jgi:HlyD family secretion protein
MDIVRVKKKFNWRQPPRLVISGVIATLILIVVFIMQSTEEYKVERNKLLFGVVQRGDLQVSVDGYGILRSQKQTLLTTLSAATVQEVILRPGAPVEEGSIIMQLSNPELLQEVETAAMGLEQEKANLRRIELSNQREMLTEESTLGEINAEVQSLTLRREAEEGLAAKGVIPQLTFKTTLLMQTHAQQRLKFQEQRISQLKSVAHEATLIQQQQINQVDARYQNIKQRADRLTVKAGMKGVLQRLPVTLGQSVAAGQELALIGSDKDLLALIRVTQSKAELLRVGQAAEINTRRETVAGLVTRITPEVHDGTIEVEIVFKDGVPTSARPELNVDARIFVSTLKDSLYVERPVNVLSNSKNSVFKIEGDNKLAEREQVDFGEDAGRFIQILNGAKEKDNFILSDLTNLRNVNRLKIID